MAAELLGPFTEGHPPRDVALAEIDRHQLGIRRLGERDRASGLSGASAIPVQ
jgi:hypothetical protein